MGAIEQILDHVNEWGDRDQLIREIADEVERRMLKVRDFEMRVRQLELVADRRDPAPVLQLVRGDSATRMSPPSP